MHILTGWRAHQGGAASNSSGGSARESHTYWLTYVLTKGERLRLLREVRDFVPHDFLRAGHAQLLLLQGRAHLAGSLQRLAMRPTPEAAAAAAAAAAAGTTPPPLT
eukprot:scaffold38677_cov49-Phaeocystis_antarctica.AAC.1